MQFNPFMTGMLVSVAIASISQVLLKKSTFVHYQSIIKEYINPYVIGGYGLLFISMLLTIYAYSGMDYKYGPVIEAFGNVFVLVLSYIFFKEKIRRRKLVGIALIVLGMVVFNL